MIPASVIGRALHLAYVCVPLMLIAGALAASCVFVLKQSALREGDRVVLCLAAETLAIWMFVGWLGMAPLKSDGLFVFAWLFVELAFMVPVAVFVVITLVLAAVRLLQRRWVASAVLAIVGVATALLVVAMVALAPDINFELKRPLREHVVASMAADPSIVHPPYGGGWNAVLPRGWNWLSADGEIGWQGTGRHSQVMFCDVSGIMSGSGYIYSLDGSPPSDAMADQADPGEVAHGWYAWHEDQ